MSALAEAGDPLRDLCVQAAALGMRAGAWAVFTHSDRIGFEHPELAPANAFGDPYLTNLCPANPDVRAYIVALAENLARYDVDVIRAESLSYRLDFYLYGLCRLRSFKWVGKALDV